MTEHLNHDTMQAFLAGRLDPAETRLVAGHLLTGCARCREEVQSLWAGTCGGDGSGSTDSESGCSDRDASTSTMWSELTAVTVEQAAHLERERGAADSACDRLESIPLGRRMMMVRNVAGFQTWSLCEELLKRAWDSRFEDVARLIELSETALTVTEVLDENEYGAAALHDLCARAWSSLGNGHSVLHEMSAAEHCFERADRELADGTGDPLELGESLKLRVAMRIRQNRLDEATALCDRQIALFERLADLQRVGEATSLMAYVRSEQGRTQEAITLWKRCLDLFDPEVDLRSVLAARHNLVYALNEEGRLDEALEVLRETRPLYAEIGDRLSALRLRYLEGLIATNLDQPLVAERCFLESRNGFVANGLAVEAAETTLELAILYLRDGRYRETRRIAEQMFPIFQTKGLEQEAMAALLIFRDAAIKESVSVQLVSETLKLVKRVHGSSD